MSVDPLLDTSDPQSLNGYSYGDNNPVNLADPSGLQLPGLEVGPPPPSSSTLGGSDSGGSVNAGAGATSQGSTSGSSSSWGGTYQAVQHQAQQVAVGAGGGIAGTADFFFNDMVDRGGKLPDAHLQSGYNSWIETHSEYEGGGPAYAAGTVAIGFAIPGLGWGRAGLAAPKAVTGSGRLLPWLKSLTGTTSTRETPILASNAPTNAANTYQTYIKVNSATGEVYAGRTSGTGTPLENLARRDSSHPYNKEGFGPATLDRSGGAAAIRGREQQLIEHYRSLGISANKINGISPTNPRLQMYMESALNEFGASS